MDIQEGTSRTLNRVVLFGPCVSAGQYSTHDSYNSFRSCFGSGADCKTDFATVELRMASSSSSSSSARAPALASAQGKNTAPPRSLAIATYNVGVREARANTSKKQMPKFLAKLEADVKALVKYGCDVLCFQELNEFWRDHLDEMLPNWTRASIDEMTVSTYVKPELEIKVAQCHPLFPESEGRKSRREVLQTVITRSGASAEQHEWNVWNNHTVSGSSSWKITGDIKKFCESALARVVEKALASAQGNRSVVCLGDWNYFKKVGFGDALRRLPGPDCLFSGEHRDFIVSFFSTHEEFVGNSIIAADGAHTAILARIGALAPAQGNTNVGLPLTSVTEEEDDEAAAEIMKQAASAQEEERQRNLLRQIEADVAAAEAEAEAEETRKRLEQREQELRQQLLEAQARAQKEKELREQLLAAQARAQREKELREQLLRQKAAEEAEMRRRQAAQEAESKKRKAEEEEAAARAAAEAEAKRRRLETEQAEAEEMARKAAEGAERARIAAERYEVLKKMLENHMEWIRENEAKQAEEEEEELLRQRRAAAEQDRQEQALAPAQSNNSVDDDADGSDPLFALMPAKALEMPIGDNVWGTRQNVVLEALKRVLALRRQVLQEMELHDLRFLPHKGQVKVSEMCDSSLHDQFFVSPHDSLVDFLFKVFMCLAVTPSFYVPFTRRSFLAARFVYVVPLMLHLCSNWFSVFSILLFRGSTR